MNHKSTHKRGLSSDYGPDLKKFKVSSETRKTSSHQDQVGPKAPFKPQCLYILTRKHLKDPSFPDKTQWDVLDIFSDAEAAYNAMKRVARKAQWWKDEDFDHELWTMSYDQKGNLMLKFDGDVEGKDQFEFKVVKKLVRPSDVKPGKLKMKVDAELEPQRRPSKHHRSSSPKGCTALSRYDVQTGDPDRIQSRRLQNLIPSKTRHLRSTCNLNSPAKCCHRI